MVGAGSRENGDLGVQSGWMLLFRDTACLPIQERYYGKPFML